MKTWIKLVVATALFGPTMQAMSAEGRAVTPEGTRALKDIGSALRGLDAYEVQMKVTTRVATEDGKYRDVVGSVHYVVEPPRHLFATLQEGGTERRIFYDGQTITVYSPAERRYALIDAPGTIQTLVETARANRNIQLPVANLF